MSQPTDEDLQLLAQFQAEFVAPLERLASEVHSLFEGMELPIDPPLGATHRVKTVATLVDKLRRGTSLSSMQDIVGLRIAGGMTLVQQDEIAHLLLRRFPGSTVIDRRAAPSNGYRALHVIALVDGARVEVQIRTRIQDLWANWIESLGDRWGRWLRYGLPAEGPDPATATRRGAIIELHKQESDLLYRIEVAFTKRIELVGRLAELDATGLETALEHAALVAESQELDAALDATWVEIEALQQQVSLLLPA